MVKGCWQSRFISLLNCVQNCSFQMVLYSSEQLTEPFISYFVDGKWLIWCFDANGGSRDQTDIGMCSCIKCSYICALFQCIMNHIVRRVLLPATKQVEAPPRPMCSLFVNLADAEVKIELLALPSHAGENTRRCKYLFCSYIWCPAATSFAIPADEI